MDRHSPVGGFGPALPGQWKSLRRFRIGTRLLVSFSLLCVVVSMAGIVSMVKNREAQEQVRQLDVTDQEVIAFLQVNNDVLAMKELVQVNSSDRDANRFRQELLPLKAITLRDIDAAFAAMALPHSAPHDHSTAQATMGLFQMSVPDDIDVLIAMAETGDWRAVELRCRNQIRSKTETMASMADQLKDRVQTERSDALSAIANTEKEGRRLPIVTLTLLGLALLVGGLLTASIVRPLRWLERAAEQLGRGDFGFRVPVVGRDELATLAIGFNEATSRLEQSYQQLEARVAERTAELEGAKQAAEKASRVKSEFLANMSHEIRTPMNGILGMTELAMDTNVGQEAMNYLKAVKSSGEALLTLINDILDFSKIEAGKLTVQAAQCALREGVAETFKSLSLPAQQKGIALLLKMAPDVPAFVLADFPRIRQVLINLIGNAIKFTAEGEVALLVEKVNTHEHDCLLRFSVRDTGIGIAGDKLGAIFDAFVQADGSVTRQYGGTGLGLSISSQLVSLMGGRISVESQPGQGSTFWFTLPCQELALEQGRIAQSDLAALQRMAQGSASPELLPVQVSPSPALRILVAEDNPVNQLLVRSMLEKQGHAVTVVADGQEAVEVTGSEPFDLVFMDLQMPRMGGLEATDCIRSRERAENRKRLPIIALTAHAMTGDDERCRVNGMDDYLSKPLRMPALKAKLDLWGQHAVLSSEA